MKITNKKILTTSEFNKKSFSNIIAGYKGRYINLKKSFYLDKK